MKCAHARKKIHDIEWSLIAEPLPTDMKYYSYPDVSSELALWVTEKKIIKPHIMRF